MLFRVSSAYSMCRHFAFRSKFNKKEYSIDKFQVTKILLKWRWARCIFNYGWIMWQLGTIIILNISQQQIQMICQNYFIWNNSSLQYFITKWFGLKNMGIICLDQILSFYPNWILTQGTCLWKSKQSLSFIHELPLLLNSEYNILGYQSRSSFPSE